MSTIVPNPIDFPDLYSKCKISGRLCPGTCKPTGWKKVYKWENKEPKGGSGGTQTYNGESINEGEIEFKLVTAADTVEWDRFVREVLIKSPDAKKPAALTIELAQINRLRISQVVVEEIGQEEVQDDGSTIVKVKFGEYKQEKKGVGGTADKSKDKSPPTFVEAPVADKYDKQISELEKEAKKP